MKLSSAASILLASIGSTYAETTTPSLESANNNSIDVDGLNNRVETSCERDVVDICRGGYGRREEEVMNPFTTKLGGMQATYPTTLLLTSSMMTQPADPFLEWMLVPSTTFYYQEFPSSSVVEEPQQKETPPTPPEVNDLSLFFDRMFGSTTGLLLSSPSFYMSPPSSSEENENGNEDASSSSSPHHREMTKKEDATPTTSSLITISSSSSSSSPAILFELVEYVVDSGVTKLASELGYEEESRSEEIPDLARQIQSRGREMLLREENDRGEEEGDDENDATATMRRRMARRLTEVDSTSIRENLLALRLPFGQDNCCLKGAHRRGFTSPECAEALDEMYAKFAEGKAALAQAQEREEASSQKPQRDLELQQLKLLRSTTHDDSSSFVYCPVFVGAVLSTALSVTLLVFWFLRVCCRICDDEEEENDEDQEGYYALMEDGEEKRNLLRAKNLVFEGVPVQVV